MRVRQFKIRVNQGSFLKNSIKDWTSNWITTNKTLSRSCLHADINLNKIVQSQGDKVSAQFGAIHISFLNNFIQIQYFSFSYLYNILPTKNKNLYEAWTLSTHYNKKYRKYKFPLLSINQSSVLKFSTSALLYKKIKMQLQLQYFEIWRCRKFKFFQTRTWDRWKRASRKFQKVKNRFHKYEEVEVNRIVYNNSKRSYFHPYYTYYFRKYVYYKFKQIFIGKIVEIYKAYTSNKNLIKINKQIKKKIYIKSKPMIILYFYKKCLIKNILSLYSLYSQLCLEQIIPNFILIINFKSNYYSKLQMQFFINFINKFLITQRHCTLIINKQANYGTLLNLKQLYNLLIKYQIFTLYSYKIKNKHKQNYLHINSWQLFLNSAYNWLTLRKKIKKIRWAPKWKHRRTIHRKFNKIIKKRLFTNIDKIVYNKIMQKSLYIKYLYVLYQKKLYLKKSINNISLSWLPQKYHRSLMKSKSIRMYFILSYYQFKITSPQLLLKFYKNFKIYYKYFHANVLKLEFLYFEALYNRLIYTYFYIRGFTQLTRNSVLKHHFIPYAIFDYNIKQKDAQFKNLTIGLVFYRAIRLWRARRNSHYLGSFDILLNVVTNLDFSRMGASFISNFCNLQLQKIPNKKMQKWFIGACKEFFKSFLLLSKNIKIKQLQFVNIQGIQFDVKGRAVDLRRVFVRRKKYGHTYNTKHGYYDVVKSYHFDFFTTKWGSTSIRVSYFFNNYYQNTKANFKSNLGRRCFMSNKLYYRKLVYFNEYIWFLLFKVKISYRNIHFKHIAKLFANLKVYNLKKYYNYRKYRSRERRIYYDWVYSHKYKPYITKNKKFKKRAF